MAKRMYLTDKEVAAILEISPVTLSRILHGFHRDGKHKTAAMRTIDLSKAQPELVGGYRRWRISNLADALGVTAAEIVERIM